MNSIEHEKKARQVCYDLVTLFRVFPWLFLIQDKRDPDVLIAAAANDAKSFVDAYIETKPEEGTDNEDKRLALMRGILYNLLTSLGLNVSADNINMLVKKIAESSNKELLVQIDDDLKGEIA